MKERDSLESSVDLHRESPGLPLVRHIPLPGKPSDMPQSLCALDHAGTGKEGNSAKKERAWSSYGMMDEQSGGMQRGESDKIVPDGWREGARTR